MKIPFDTTRIEEMQYKYMLEKGILITEDELIDKKAIYHQKLDYYWNNKLTVSKKYDYDQVLKVLKEMFRDYDGLLYIDFPFGRMGFEPICHCDY